MDAIALLRLQLDAAHKGLEETMAGVTPEQLHWTPPGIANPLGATYAHLIFSEDYIVQGMLQQKPPLAFTAFEGKTGLSEPMPNMGPEWAGYAAWARRARVDLPVLREYGQAVYAATDAYVGGLTPEMLDQTMDVGMGSPVTTAWVLTMFLLEHISNMCGEVAVLKGLQGAKGYPF